MTINTIDFNTKEGEIIPIDDVDVNFLQPLMRSSQEINQQQNLWNSKNADYVKQMEQKRKLKENKKLKDGKQNAVQSQPVSFISHSESKYAYSQGGMVKGDIISSESNQDDVIDQINESISENSKKVDKYNLITNNGNKRQRGSSPDENEPKPKK